jgi:hypothetical protein
MRKKGVQRRILGVTLFLSYPWARVATSFQ